MEALRAKEAQYTINLWVGCSSQASVRAITNQSERTSQRHILGIQKLMEKWGMLERHAGTRKGKASVIWIPKQAELEHHEQAKQLAREAATMGTHVPLAASQGGAEKWVKTQLEEDFKTWWESTSRKEKTEWPPPRPRCPPELHLPRHLLAHWLSARSGHGDYHNYHERFKHHEAERNCRCGTPKSARHILTCRRAVQTHLLERWKNRHIRPEQLFITTEGAFAFSVWAGTTGYFESTPTN
jgi:hypothetical protein